MEVRASLMREATVEEVVQSVVNFLQIHKPTFADMNLDSVHKALVTGWQLLEVKYAPFIQAVPGIPSVIFRLKKDGKEANIPVVVGPKVLQFLREQGQNLAQQGVGFWIGTE